MCRHASPSLFLLPRCSSPPSRAPAMDDDADGTCICCCRARSAQAFVRFRAAPVRAFVAVPAGSRFRKKRRWLRSLAAGPAAVRWRQRWLAGLPPTSVARWSGARWCGGRSSPVAVRGHGGRNSAQWPVGIPDPSTLLSPARSLTAD